MVVEAKAKIKMRHQRAIVQFKEWVGQRSFDEIPMELKARMFDHFVDKGVIK